MKTNSKILVAAMLLLGAFGMTTARTKDQATGKKNEGSQVLRTSTGVFDLQRNSVSAVDLYVTNYGIIGHDVRNNRGGGLWPRGTQNQYMYGGGIWFAAKKKLASGDTNKLCEISYNPNSGASWLAPGMIEDGDDAKDELATKYRAYFSTDFNKSSGVPNTLADGPNWPIWNTSTNPTDTLKRDRYFGFYEDDIAKRNSTEYPKGPAFISGEDIFSVFKDTDMSRYEGGKTIRQGQGYPMRLQYEQMIYSWGEGDYKDFMFVKYLVINKSKDTLIDCWAASAYDMDIAQTTNGQNGAGNDRTKFYDDDQSLNLAVQWSLGTQGELNRGFGYIGFDFLESPAVDTLTRFIRKDKKFYPNSEQLGLVTFRNWIIDNDPKENAERYDFVSTRNRDGDNDQGDKRFLMSSGPFHLRPMDTARVVVGIIFANSIAGNATGTVADLAELVRKDKFAQTVYDNNFQAPVPPDISKISWRPLNNAVIVTWDSTAELSYDDKEDGLDFLGYRLYRGRKGESDLDSFDVDVRTSVKKSPLGWKQIAQWEMMTPFFKSLVKAGKNNVNMPFYDSVRIVRQIDNYTFQVRRFPNRCTSLNPYGTGAWAKYYSQMPIQELNKILTGEIVINSALVTNPPKWKNTNRLQWIISRGGQLFVDNTANPITDGIDIPWKPVLAAQAPGSVWTATEILQYDTLTQNLTDLILQGKARLIFPDIEPDKATINKIRQEVIVPYMDSITNNSSFVDIGDDNGDGTVTEEINPIKTEKLLNNVDYYYRLLAYDEGDYVALSASKLNTGASGLNITTAYPLAAPTGAGSASLQVTGVDSSTMGGLYNFKFQILDVDRFNQLFTSADNEGHEIEIEFQPAWSLAPFPLPTTASPNPAQYGLYQRRILMRDKTTGKLLYDGTTNLEPILCNPTFPELFTENAATYVQTDAPQIDSLTGQVVNTFGVPTDKGQLVRKGTFYIDKTVPCYTSSLLNEAQQTLGFSFDYGIQQQGGKLRVDTAFAMVNATAAETPIKYNPDVKGGTRVDTVFDEAGNGRIIFGSFNNGPANYELEFTEGGVDSLTVSYGTTTPQTTKTIAVRYLNTKVKNTITYRRINEFGDSVTVAYPNDVPHATIALQGGATYPDPTTVPIGNYNLSTYGWVSARGRNNLTARRAQVTGLVGQGKYYLSTVNDRDTIDFVNIFAASGAEFGLDYANKGRRFANDARLWDTVENYVWNKDFVPGDKVTFKVTGGALGLPLPGAKLTAKVSSGVPKIDQYTDEKLEQINVVPNPYYVSHQAQRTPNAAKIFFTKLPKQCTISIYTVAGDLIRTIEHNEFTSTSADTYATEVWDLLSNNGQRASSQSLIAEFKTPNGSKTIKKFSIIVGGFRVISE
jgi:hypothetical protein